MVHALSVMVDGACSQAVAFVLPTLLVDMDMDMEVGNHAPTLPLRLNLPTYHLCPHTCTHHPHTIRTQLHSKLYS